MGARVHAYMAAVPENPDGSLGAWPVANAGGPETVGELERMLAQESVSPKSVKEIAANGREKVTDA